MLELYNHKEKVKVIKYTGDNFDEIKEFYLLYSNISDDSIWYNPDNNIVIVDNHIEFLYYDEELDTVLTSYLNVGEYLIIDIYKYDRPFVLCDNCLKEKYEKINIKEK